MSIRIRVSGAAALAAAQAGVLLALIERWHPFFFLQDDNRNFVLPYLIHNWRAISSGRIAVFNFFQYCGTPALANGVSETLYPPAYAATGLSHLLFGSAYAAVDLLIAFHLLLGVVGAYFCFRELGLSHAAAVWAAPAAVMNSFVIYVGDSWAVVPAAAAYLPWALGFALRFAQGRKWAASGLALSNLLWFLNGYPQLLLYGAVFEAIFFFVTVRRSEVPLVRAILAYAGNCVVTGLLAAPLLLPMLRQAQVSALRADRIAWPAFVWGAYSPWRWLQGVVWPFSDRAFSTIPDRMYLERLSAYASHLSYPVAAAALIGLLALWRGRLGEEGRPGRLAGACALTAFLWSIGALSPLLYLVPLFNRMRWPFKLQLFTALFLAALAGWALDRAFAKKPGRRRVYTALLCLLTVADFGALYAGTPIRAFRSSAGPLPVPEPLAESLKDGRTLTVGYRFSDLDAPGGLAFDHPTMWGIQAFGGYDPLVTKLNHEVALGLNHMSSMECGRAIAHLGYLRSWAVSYYVVSPAAGDCGARLAAQGLTLLHQDSLRSIFRDGKAAPIVSWESGSEDGIRCRTGVNAVHCQAASAVSQTIRMRYAAHRFFAVKLDRREVPFSRDRNQIVFPLPAGEHAIELRYRDPLFEVGWKIALGTLLALAAAAVMRSAGRLRPVIPVAPD
jgi:hypothetical protein